MKTSSSSLKSFCFRMNRLLLPLFRRPLLHCRLRITELAKRLLKWLAITIYVPVTLLSAAEAAIGGEIRIVKDVDNPVHPNALQLLTAENVAVGYIPRNEAAIWCPYIDRPQFRFHSVAEFKSGPLWVNVACCLVILSFVPFGPPCRFSR